MPEQPTRDFYDHLADNYHLLYPDWDTAITRQAHALDRLIRREYDPGPQALLDCACGIGTQALGLAALGHHVFATDLSSTAVARTAREAHTRHLAVATAVTDMRALPFRSACFDVVVCADNALPHLLTPDDQHTALASMRRVLKPGGLLLITTRPYDAVRAIRPRSTPPHTSTTPAGRAITFQLWDWHTDGEHYDLELFVLTPHNRSWSIQVHRTTYWALTQAQITDFVLNAGFAAPAWHRPEDTGFFQPLLTARNPTDDHKPQPPRTHSNSSDT